MSEGRRRWQGKLRPIANPVFLYLSVLLRPSVDQVRPTHAGTAGAGPRKGTQSHGPLTS